MTNKDQPAEQGRGVESRESRMVVIERDAQGTPTVWCDPEIVDLVTALNKGGIPTVASCSGHGERRGNIALRDGRELLIAPNFEAGREMEAALSLPRQSEAAPDDDWHLRGYLYASKQGTHCAGCGQYKHTPLRVDEMGGYVCLTCIDKQLEQFFDTTPPAAQGEALTDTFIQEVPDKCDRIIWRGQYHHLPLKDTTPAAHGVGDGMVVVPREPTEKMIDAGFPEAGFEYQERYVMCDVWAAMIKAAPGGL